MEREGYSPDEKAAIESAVQRTSLEIDADDFNSEMLGVGRKFGKFYPQDVEEILRKIESPIYIHASPTSSNLVGRLPQTGERDLPYVMTFTVKGLAEAGVAFVGSGIGYEENFENLAEAGFITVKQPIENS